MLQTIQITWKLEQEIACHYGQEFLDSLKHWDNNTNGLAA
jgi:hypothetical protein